MEDLNLPGNNTIQPIRKQNSLEKQINFKSLSKLLNTNTFINPPFQTDLDEDRVQEMVNSYLKNPEYLIFKNKITIAVLFTQNNEYLLYLVDGQHRIEMGIKLYNDHDVSDYLTLCYFKVFNIQEVEDLFNECNKDSYKNKIVFDKNIMKKIKYKELKEQLTKKYSEYSSKTKASANVKYSITDFLDVLDKIEYLSLDLDLLNNLETKNKKFNKIIDYSGYLEENSDYFYKEEINCISNGFTFFLKNNNFIDYLMDQTIIPDHLFKNYKNKISPKLRIQVWKSEFNDDDYENEQKCIVYRCNNIISNDANGFQCGFIISRHNEGQLTLDNLKPICIKCYNKMGSTNWDEFIANCKKEYKTTKKVVKTQLNDM